MVGAPLAAPLRQPTISRVWRGVEERVIRSTSSKKFLQRGGVSLVRAGVVMVVVTRQLLGCPSEYKGWLKKTVDGVAHVTSVAHSNAFSKFKW